MPLNQAFDRLANPGLWEDVIILAAAFMAGALVKNTIEGRVGVNLPDEAYGLLTAAGGTYVLSGNQSRFAVIGGGLYTADALATRMGIKATVENLAAQGGA